MVIPSHIELGLLTVGPSKLLRRKSHPHGHPLVRHTVSDYTAWRKVYDDLDATRKSMGVTSDAVYQLDGNPNDITAYHEFDSMARRRRSLEAVSSVRP